MKEWKETVLSYIHRRENIINRSEEKAEEACVHNNAELAKKMYARADKAELYIEGALDVLEAIGFTIRFNNNHDVEEIIGECHSQYRIRYKHLTADHHLISSDTNKVQEIINTIKKLSPEYELVGMDDRIISPNGECGTWNKIFDF